MARFTDSRLALTIPEYEIEAEAQNQIEKILELDCLVRLAVMPDVHSGYDMPIGGVVLLDGMVSPSFVGYDIGCGMCHVNTGRDLAHFGLDGREARDGFLEKLREAIPVGFATHDKPAVFADFRSASGDKSLAEKVNAVAGKQLGTLGGGNHFLEVGINADGNVGLTIHSGSRRAGWEIGNWYMKKGRLLSVKSDMGRAYLEDMEWALQWALGNRLRMLSAVLALMGEDPRMLLDHARLVNENHNHATVTENGVLHRKGATPAHMGQYGIIPANQRDGVYVTKGLGNENFLWSASHGAGRSMSRSKAKEKLDVEDFQIDMMDVSCRADASTLDEAPGAYKDIGSVLAAQEGILINVVDHFRPMIVLKG